MKFCSKCGNELLDEAVMCPKCGCPVNEHTIIESKLRKEQQEQIKKRETISVKPKRDSDLKTLSKSFVVEYLNENEFKKKERAVKKYNMLAYKKLVFEIYPELREGKFQGIKVCDNIAEGISKYKLKLPTPIEFDKIHGPMELEYTVYENQKTILLNTITPEGLLTEGHQYELCTYKGVMVSKSHAEKDMFKINLLNMINKD